MKRNSLVTVHMAASLDGFIARKDGSVDWMDSTDHFEDGATMDPEFVAEFLQSIDCYVMGSRTYETALGFEAKGHGWAYAEKPVHVLTRRILPKARPSVAFLSGDLRELLDQTLRPKFANIWVVGGGAVCGDCIRLGLADEVRVSLLPVLIGNGIPFFQGLDRDVLLHLKEAKAYQSGMIALRHEVRR